MLRKASKYGIVYVGLATDKEIKSFKNIKQELNEWNDTTFRNKPKRWTTVYHKNQSLTEFEKQNLPVKKSLYLIGLCCKWISDKVAILCLFLPPSKT